MQLPRWSAVEDGDDETAYHQTLGQRQVEMLERCQNSDLLKARPRTAESVSRGRIVNESQRHKLPASVRREQWMAAGAILSAECQPGDIMAGENVHIAEPFFLFKALSAVFEVTQREYKKHKAAPPSPQP